MKRANGTGTVVKLPGTRRNPYAVRIAGRDKYGYVVQKYLSYHRTASEAQKALEEYNALSVKPSMENYDKTLLDVYDMWSARTYSKKGAASVASHKAAWKRVSTLAGKKMRDIGIDDWQGIVDAAEAEGCSKSTITNIVLLEHALSKFAMERDIINKDYSQFVEMPSVGAKMQKGAFNDIQMQKLRKMAADGVPWADTVLILCYTGFRITEFLTLTQFSYNAQDNYLCGGIKTDAGKNRIVPVHPIIKPYLDKWLAKGGETIICQENKTAVSGNWYRKNAFAPIAAALGAPEATPHWCRHTFATMLNNAGVPELERKRLLGHADKNVTEHYTHSDIKTLTKWLLKVA